MERDGLHTVKQLMKCVIVHYTGHMSSVSENDIDDDLDDVDDDTYNP